MSQRFEKHCPASMSQQFLELMNRSKSPKHSTNKLRDTVLMRKHGISNNESTAETLICTLDNDGTQSHVCCTGSYDEEKELVRVRRKDKKKGENLQRIIRNHETKLMSIA